MTRQVSPDLRLALWQHFLRTMRSVHYKSFLLPVNMYWSILLSALLSLVLCLWSPFVNSTSYISCVNFTLLYSQALMNGSDMYQKNERNRQEFKKIRAAAAARHHAEHPQDVINLPFFIGLGLGLGLNIVGYFAFKAYFRSFLQSMNSRPRSGAPYGVKRSDFEGVNRYKQQRQQQHQYYYHYKQHSSTSNSSSGRQHASNDSQRQSRSQSSSSSSSSSGRKQQENDRTSMIRKHLLQLDMPLTSLHPSVADIKRAYRALSLKTHPDVTVAHSNSNSDSDTGVEQKELNKKELERLFMQATVAHDELLRRLHGK